MKSLFELLVGLAAYSVIPLIIYLIGYALQNQRISRFGIGIGKILFIAQSWFFIYVVCLESYAAIFISSYGSLYSSKVASDEAMLTLMISTAVIYGLIVIGLVRRGKLSFFKQAPKANNEKGVTNV